MQIQQSTFTRPAKVNFQRKPPQVKIPDALRIQGSRKISKGPLFALLTAAFIALGGVGWHFYKPIAREKQIEHVLKEIEKMLPADTTKTLEELPADTVSINTVI